MVQSHYHSACCDAMLTCLSGGKYLLCLFLYTLIYQHWHVCKMLIVISIFKKQKKVQF